MAIATIDIAIIGAGLCGLALAAGLQKRGLSVEVFEKTDGKRADTATGISIGLNGGRALDGILPGLLNSMKSAGSEPKSLRVVDHSNPTAPVEVQVPKIPVLFMIPWRRARSILLDLVLSSSIHCNHKLVSYRASDSDELVELVFQVKDEQTGELTGELTGEKRVFARLVIGADGVHSVVRKLMVGDHPRDLHFINWNSLVYNPDSKFFKAHEKDEIVLIKNGASMAHLADSGEDCTLWVLRIPNDDIQSAAFGGEDTKTRVLKAINELQPPQIWEPLKIAAQSTPAESIYQRRIIDNPPLKSWSDLQGRVLLVGDAAHAMHWGPGQGARTAFEDAHQLCEALSSVGVGVSPSTTELKNAVKRFEKARICRMTRFQEFAAEGTDLPEFIPEWVQKLSYQERLARSRQFQAWADSYPEKLDGDPDSEYFKPLECEIENESLPQQTEISTHQTRGA